MKKSISILVLFAVTACGGGGGGSSSSTEGDGSGSVGSPPSERPSGVLVGTAFDNLLINADILVASLDGTIVGTGQSDNEGIYSVDLESVPSQSLRITTSGGHYVEEYSEQNISIDANDGGLTALINYTVGDSIDVSLTYLTTIAAGYAEYLINTGMTTEEAIDTANSRVSNWVGFDILVTTPVDVMDVRNASVNLTNALRYAFTTAAISATTEQISQYNNLPVHRVYNSIGFAQKAYDDILYDGLLNGVDVNGSVTMGTFVFTTAVYRNTHALNMLAIANSDNNATSITPADLINAASEINSLEGVFFDPAELLIDLDVTIPTIRISSIVEGQALWGSVDFDFDVTDIVGINTIDVQIGDGSPMPAFDILNPSVVLNTLTYPDGPYDLTVTATNTVGGVNSATLSIIIKNNGVAITNLNPLDKSIIRGNYNFSAQVTDSIGIADINFVFNDSLHYNDIDVDSPELLIDTASIFSDGNQHTFTVDATNTVGSTVSAEVSFIVDNSPPSADIDLLSGLYHTENFSFDILASDNVGMASANLYVDGNLLQNYPLNEASNFLDNVSIVINNYPEGLHTFYIEVFDLAGSVDNQEQTAIFDLFPPTISIVESGVLTIHETFNITYTASDFNGIAKVDLFIDNTLVDSKTSTNGAFTINPNGHTEGNKILRLVATDTAGRTTSSEVSRNFQHLPLTMPSVLAFQERNALNRERYIDYTIPITNASPGEIVSVTASGFGDFPGLIHVPLFSFQGSTITTSYLINRFDCNDIDIVSKKVDLNISLQDIYGRTFVFHREMHSKYISCAD